MAKAGDIIEIEAKKADSRPEPSLLNKTVHKVGKIAAGAGVGVIIAAVAIDNEAMGIAGLGVAFGGAFVVDDEVRRDLVDFGHEVVEFDYVEFGRDVGRTAVNKLLRRDSTLE